MVGRLKGVPEVHEAARGNHVTTSAPAVKGKVHRWLLLPFPFVKCTVQFSFSMGLLMVMLHLRDCFFADIPFPPVFTYTYRSRWGTCMRKEPLFLLGLWGVCIHIQKSGVILYPDPGSARPFRPAGSSPVLGHCTAWWEPLLRLRGAHQTGQVIPR